MAAGRLWVCPKCGHEYASPIRLEGLSHRCPENRGLAVELKEVRRTACGEQKPD